MTPGWKTTELYAALLAGGALLKGMAVLQADLPELAKSEAPWMASMVPVAQMLLGLSMAALGKWYMDHRRALKLADLDAAPQIPGGFASVKLLCLMATICVAIAQIGCHAHLTPYESRVVDCGKDAVLTAVPTLIPQVQQALTQPDTFSSSRMLDALLATSGDAAVCAVEVTIAALEGQVDSHAPQSASMGTNYLLQLVRAQSWLQGCQWSNQYRAGGGFWLK